MIKQDGFMKKIEEALKLSEEILQDIELDRIILERVVFKCGRLARLMNEGKAIKWLEYEIS